MAVHHCLADSDGSRFGSLAIKGGPNYGIDFKGGTLMTVKFAQNAAARHDPRRVPALRRQTKGEVSVQTITDASTRMKSRSAPERAADDAQLN